MASSSIVDFSKNILLPVLIAGALYLLVFHALLPLYRRNRVRYSQYLPLQSASISSHLPRSLQPSSLRDRASYFFVRLFLPTTWASSSESHSHSHRRSSVDSTGEEPLFDDESGEAMVGFDVHSERSRRRDGMDRQVAQGINAAREMSAYYNTVPAPADSEQRLGRELEEGFRDESEDEDEAQESTVTAGRRSFSASR